MKKDSSLDVVAVDVKPVDALVGSKPEDVKADVKPVDPEVETLSKVPTFEGQFGQRTTEEQRILRDLGEHAKRTIDPKTTGLDYVTLGWLCDSYLVERYKTLGGEFSRATAIEECKLDMRIYGVPESLNKPANFIAVFQMARLSLSTPGASDGMPRTFTVHRIPEDWFGGNISYGALLDLVPTVSRVNSGKTADSELDVWEFDSNAWEAWTRQILDRLRSGSLTGTMALALRKNFDTKLKADQRREERANKSTMGADQLEQFLRNKGVIPAVPRPSMANVNGLASVMIPGDAKSLVQALAAIAESNPSKMDVFVALKDEVQVVMKRWMAQKAETATLPMKATG